MITGWSRWCCPSALLRSGKNVITTAGQHYPAAHGPDRLAMFADAARAGGVTLYGTGMNPGYVLERLVLGLTRVWGQGRTRRTSICGRVRWPTPPGTGLRTKAGQYVTPAAVINAIPAVAAFVPR